MDTKEKLLDGLPTDKLKDTVVVDDPEKKKPSKEEGEGNNDDEPQDPKLENQELPTSNDDDGDDESSEEEKALLEKVNALDDQAMQDLLDKENDDLTDEEKQMLSLINDEETEETVVEQLIKADGYELEPEFIEELKKDGDSQEALNKYTNKIAQIKADELFNSNPIVSSLHGHLANGGTFESFKKANTIDPFASMKLSEDTEESTLESVIKHDLSQKGVDDEDISSIIKTAKKDGKLFDKANKSHESISSRDKEKRQQVIQQEQQRIAQEKQAAQQEQDEILAMLDNNKLDRFSLPQTKLKEFKKAFTTPIDREGRTILDQKWDKLNTAQKTLLDYIVYEDFNLKGLLENKNTIQLDKLRKKQNDKRSRDFKSKPVSSGGKVTPQMREKLKSLNFNK